MFEIGLAILFGVSLVMMIFVTHVVRDHERRVQRLEYWVRVHGPFVDPSAVRVSKLSDDPAEHPAYCLCDAHSVEELIRRTAE